MSWIIVGDPHFTEHARDAYRFDLFPWLKKQQTKYNTSAIFIAGDLADNKDRHSATLVNKIVEGLTSLKPPIYIAMGNHDYRDPDNPFFKFLNHIDGIHFTTDPVVVNAHHKMAIVPHYREQDQFDGAVRSVLGDCPDAFLCHQTFDGAIAETGATLTGLSASWVRSYKWRLGAYAGDVHRPQIGPNLIYVGCPYHVRFGDNFNPRILLVKEKGKPTNLNFSAPYKWSLQVTSAQDILTNKKLMPSDQAKIIVRLTREEIVEWKEIKRSILDVCQQRELEVYGIKMEVPASTPLKRIKLTEGMSNEETYAQFCKYERVASEIKEAGASLLREAGDKNG